jgi:hypothetical protein
MSYKALYYVRSTKVTKVIKSIKYNTNCNSVCKCDMAPPSGR